MLSCHPTVTRAPDDRQPLRSIIFFNSCILGVSRESRRGPQHFLCPKHVKINVDLSPLCLCLIPSKLIWLCVQSCQNKYGLIAESASASHGAPRLLSSPAVCSQGRGLDHKLQICTEDVQILFFLLQFGTVFLNSFVSICQISPGWKF